MTLHTTGAYSQSLYSAFCLYSNVYHHFAGMNLRLTIYCQLINILTFTCVINATLPDFSNQRVLIRPRVITFYVISNRLIVPHNLYASDRAKPIPLISDIDHSPYEERAILRFRYPRNSGSLCRINIFTVGQQSLLDKELSIPCSPHFLLGTPSSIQWHDNRDLSHKHSQTRKTRKGSARAEYTRGSITIPKHQKGRPQSNIP